MLFNFFFKGGEKQFIAVKKFDGKWTDNKYEFITTFDKDSLINSLPDNSFFIYGNLSFQQITGIPMSSDPALFMSNLF